MDDDERRMARALTATGYTLVGMALTQFDPTPRYLVRFSPAVAHAGHDGNVRGPDTLPERDRLIDAMPQLQRAD